MHNRSLYKPCKLWLFVPGLWTLLLAGAAPNCPTAAALDYVTVREGDSQRELAGKIEVEAVDGGVLLLCRDGSLWPIAKEELIKRRSDERPFVALSRDEIGKQLAAELPEFKSHATQHYLIYYNTSTAYARWVGGLFEGLHKAFYTYWSQRGAVLHEPEFPLVALVFDGQSSFAKHAHQEIGERAASIIGYYSLKTNRVTMCDLTGVEANSSLSERNASARIHQILSQPAAERNVATIVHEATHQLAFNSGLQTRYADMPFCISEGIAMYFETPNLESTKGWRNVGAVNRVNLGIFRRYLPRRPAGSLETLLTDDKRFSNSATDDDAYAEAWALSYFLLQKRAKVYVKYLAALAEQKPLVDVEPAERIRTFQQFFGEDLSGLEGEFLRYMKGVN
jgi:Protein of unknown function (DUF1570)